MTASPFIRDVPVARAQAAWRDACEAAGCPARIPANGEAESISAFVSSRSSSSWSGCMR